MSTPPLPRAIVSASATAHLSVSGLFYGYPGCGKTVLAGTGADTLVLSTEDGRLTMADFGSTAKVWPIRKWEDATEAANYLDTPHPFKTVWVDNTSELQQVLMEDVVTATYRANPAKRHEVIPAQDNYLETQLLLKRFIRRLNALPVNTFWSCHVALTDDAEGNELGLPLLRSKNYALAQEVAGMMPFVAYLKETTKGDEFSNRLMFRKDGPYLARSRFQALQKPMDMPTVPKILARLQTSTTPQRGAATGVRKPPVRRRPQ
jgi:hypothetical protein